jgi:heme o synthase
MPATESPAHQTDGRTPPPIVPDRAGVVSAGIEAAGVHLDANPVSPGDSLFALLVELSKPRITRLVTMTAGVGFVLAVVGHGIDLLAMAICAIGCLAGTALSSAGANALNQWMEKSRDGLMPRTRLRPLPTGRMTPRAALIAGLVFSLLGVVMLAVLCGPAAALVSLTTILVYVLLYTPTKPITPMNTLIGAIPGALPPLIGWCAAASLVGGAGWYASLLDPAGWTLFALMFVWQLPHFLAIAWMYKDDYAAGGHRMLSWYDPTGRYTGLVIVGTAITLIPATLLPVYAMPGVLGWPYAIIAAVSGGVYVALCLRLLGGMQRPRARAVFFASIIHLPVLLLAMTAEAGVRAFL